MWTGKPSTQYETWEALFLIPIILQTVGNPRWAIWVSIPCEPRQACLWGERKWEPVCVFKLENFDAWAFCETCQASPLVMMTLFYPIIDSDASLLCVGNNGGISEGREATYVYYWYAQENLSVTEACVSMQAVAFYSNRRLLTEGTGQPSQGGLGHCGELIHVVTWASFWPRGKAGAWRGRREEACWPLWTLWSLTHWQLLVPLSMNDWWKGLLGLCVWIILYNDLEYSDEGIGYTIFLLGLPSQAFPSWKEGVTGEKYAF